MKQVLYLLLTGFAFASCSDAKNDAKTENESIAVVEKYLDAAHDKDFKTMDSLLADNFVSYGPSHADSINKASALKDWEIIAATYYDEIKYNNLKLIGSEVTSGVNPGQFVSAWAEITLTYKDTARKPITTYANVIYKVENGKIVMSRRFYNEADIMRQAGYSLVPGQ